MSALRSIKLADVLAEHAARQRRASGIQPRLVRRQDAASYLTAPQLFVFLEEALWIIPTVNRHRMTLFDLNDVDACIERLKSGEFPHTVENGSGDDAISSPTSRTSAAPSRAFTN